MRLTGYQINTLAELLDEEGHCDVHTLSSPTDLLVIRDDASAFVIFPDGTYVSKREKAKIETREGGS